MDSKKIVFLCDYNGTKPGEAPHRGPMTLEINSRSSGRYFCAPMYKHGKLFSELVERSSLDSVLEPLSKLNTIDLIVVPNVTYDALFYPKTTLAELVSALRKVSGAPILVDGSRFDNKDNYKTGSLIEWAGADFGFDTRGVEDTIKLFDALFSRDLSVPSWISGAKFYFNEKMYQEREGLLIRRN